MSTSKSPELALHIWEEGKHLTQRHSCYHIHANVVTVGQRGEIRNVRWDTLALEDRLQIKSGGVWQDFRIYSQGNANDRDYGLYAWEYSFRDVFEINLCRAESMVKALKHVGKTMEQLREKDGREQTFGQFALRVARCIGCSQIVSRDDDQYRLAYDESNWKQDTLVGGMERIDWWVKRWQEAGKEHAVTA